MKLAPAKTVFAQEEPGGDAERIQYVFRQALGRTAKAAELKIVTALLHKHRDEFGKDAKAAAALLSVGFHPRPADLPRRSLEFGTFSVAIPATLRFAVGGIRFSTVHAISLVGVIPEQSRQLRLVS